MESSPLELLVFDELSDCPYLPGQIARLPHRLPTALSPEDFDQRLQAGDRRSGPFLYRTRCPQCTACEPIRLDVDRHRLGSSQAKAWKRGNALLEAVVQEPVLDDERVNLFNKHRLLRGLAKDDKELDHDGYANFLVITCCQTQEISYYAEGKLVAVAITDFGANALSAVYTYYDPDFTALSLGTYSILRQLELCRETGRQHLYLGFFIADCAAMRYKGNFHPHERRVNGVWSEFE